MRRLLLCCAIAALSIPGFAQFFDHGADPSWLKWYSIETPSYRIIYPSGADSLARAYGTLLESYGAAASKSIGLKDTKKLPVVLHTHNVYSNGSVGWAPRRMDLFTIPDAYSPDPVPWAVQLAAHEPRHHAQMMFARKGWVNCGRWLLGEAFEPLVWAYALDFTLGEGDAVAFETSVVNGTRARTADFLEYYRVALGEGESRTYNRWRYGSFKKITPDVYRTGYLVNLGARVIGEDPGAINEAVEKTLHKPWLYSPYNINAKEAFRKGLEAYGSLWEENRKERGPFMEGKRISPVESFPVEYSSLTELSGTLYMTRSGFTKSAELVKYRDGVFTSIRSFSSHHSSLYADETRSRIYWSETLPDSRWDLAGSSVVRYLDTGSGKTVTLTHKGRLYNPFPSEDGTFLSVTEYPVEGGSRILIINADNGSTLASYPAPADIQAVESTTLEGKLYVLGVSAEGVSVYMPEEGWKELFTPVSFKMRRLGRTGGYLTWISDQNGVNELYGFAPGDDAPLRITNTRYGTADYAQTDSLFFYTECTLDGKAIKEIPLSELKAQKTTFEQTFTYPLEEALTRQEEALVTNVNVEFSEVKRYSRLLHAINIHSWAPAYLDYDSIREGSFDLSYETLSPGAMVFFQNVLGTLSGSAGLAVRPADDGAWTPSFHTKFIWKGWYPVIEGEFNYSGNSSRQYFLQHLDTFGEETWGVSAYETGTPYISGSLHGYVPLKFNRGGYMIGLIPQMRIGISNNLFSCSSWNYKAPDMLFAGLPASYRFVGFSKGDNHLVGSFLAAVRGYAMLSTPHSRVYPRLGIGGETGISIRPSLEGVYSPCAYGYLYGYLPGLYQTHGLRLTALAQGQLNRQSLFADTAVNITPRGFNSTVRSFAVNSGAFAAKITADYSAPIYLGDISLMPLTYIRNFVLTPHADLMFGSSLLWSLGADLTASLANIAFLSFDASVGVSFSWLGGNPFPEGQTSHFYVAPVFSMSL